MDGSILSGDVVTFTREKGRDLATGVERELSYESIHVAGRFVGYLFQKGQVGLVREVSDSDRNLIEVAAAQYTGQADVTSKDSAVLTEDKE